MRAMGSRYSTYPNPENWTLDGENVEFDLLSIRLRTRALAIRKMDPPPAPEAWAEPERLPHVKLPWNQIWRLRSFFATPRDMITWLKAIHRNLYLNGHDDEDDRCKICTAHKENILHLVQCKDIQRDFWDPLARVIAAMGLPIPDDPTDRPYFSLAVWQTLRRRNSRRHHVRHHFHRMEVPICRTSTLQSRQRPGIP